MIVNQHSDTMPTTTYVMSFKLSEEAKQKLHAMASEERRSMTKQIEVLIAEAYASKYGLNNAEPIGKAV